jgi:hypothetical protein
MNCAEGLANMRKLLDDYEAQMQAREPDAARNTAYQMLAVLTGIYNAAYYADMERLRGEGKPS